MQTKKIAHLRIIPLILLGTSAVMSLLSGAGTTCVALAAERFGERMASLVPYKGLYLLFVILTLGVGVLELRALAFLIRKRTGGYLQALIALILAVVISLIHMITSRILRGSSQPVDMVVYTNLFTLLVFLFIRLHPRFQTLGFEKSDKYEGDQEILHATTAFLGGLLILAVPSWVGPTHIIAGVNYAKAWDPYLSLTGFGLMLCGILRLLIPLVGQTMLFRSFRSKIRPSQHMNR